MSRCVARSGWRTLPSSHSISSKLGGFIISPPFPNGFSLPTSHLPVPHPRLIHPGFRGPCLSLETPTHPRALITADCQHESLWSCR